ncbi:amino acid adenylation domain-containing protein [Streptomyces filamentosus]|uniref:Amino acid adenylation domain-containing protein n=2 Tax=Streptomyces filamentosus TaxID=67294 RepID=A0ABY4UW97_STRFL|nr:MULTISPECIES: amino acid adenylation domain-containing protein [Streptomyces]ESU48722.1 phenyloxazoline synthase mbtB [Streptomyces sp. HCCB10043]MYR79846.1 AMP-binding protein [Streptomyces sp. SID5466]USC48607.1 amino acid adenylation domain-containing protein [Streptomyces filamentosus]
MTTIWDVVAERAAADPSAVAISDRSDITYGELVERATALADAVGARAAPGSLLAVDASGGTAGVVALLAGARVRCAVLPLNLEQPPLRRARLMAEARPSLVLTEADDYGFTVAEPGAEAVPEPREPSLQDVAYVLYTSGSTGRPKGVAVPHRSLTERIAALARVPGLAAGESMVSMTALSFDISLAELLVPLSVGGRFITAPPMARLDPDAFIRFSKDHPADVVQATPSFWRLALKGGWQGSSALRVWCGGEALTPSLAGRLRPLCRELWNLYGPTEATIWATAARIDDADAVSLGEPLPGTSVCLARPTEADSTPAGLVTEPGEEGEILLYGAGLALGYLDRDDLTEKAFVTHDTPDGPRRVYRTGDRGRYRADGGLEFLGRADAQVKLRGHRLELGSVEAALEEHPTIGQAAVVLRDTERPEHTYMEAFMVAADTLEQRELRTWLRGRLPASEHPRRFTFVTELPRTTAGKVDRVKLAQWSGEPGTDKEPA